MFKHRLALALGRTIQELDATLTSAELSQWIAYYTIEPFGAERDNYHAAMITSLLANIHRPKNQRAYTTSDFMMRDAEDAKKRETQKTLSLLDALSHGS